MKKIVFILLFPVLCYPQHTKPQSKRVLSNNEAILAFVDANIGKRVGNGVCCELAEKAIKQVDKKWRWQDKGKYGKRIWLKKNAKPGDFIQFDKVTVDNSYMDRHVAILYKILTNGYLMAEQNVNDKPRYSTKKDSKVRIDNLSTLHTIKGHIRIYRHN
jgi:hypothetical protein